MLMFDRFPCQVIERWKPLPRYSIIVDFEDLFAFLISGSLHNKQHYTTAHNNNLLFWLMVHRFIRVFDFSISNIKGIAMYHHTKTIIYYQYLYDLLIRELNSYIFNIHNYATFKRYPNFFCNASICSIKC